MMFGLRVCLVVLVGLKKVHYVGMYVGCKVREVDGVRDEEAKVGYINI